MIKKLKRSARIHLGILTCILLFAGIYYHPNSPSNQSNSTLTYDVAGYYMYLPATFIYKDLKHFSFKDTLNTAEINVGIYHGKTDPKSGNFVIKYSSGMAFNYLPFFTIAHVWAKSSDKYADNGFSYPYHFCLYFGSLFIAIIGMFFLYSALKIYFDPWIAFLSCLSILIGSNYLIYATYHGAMSHNYLFTLYAILLYTLPSFYKNPKRSKAIGIGCILGLAILIRPTEALTGLLALFWATAIFSKENINSRWRFIKSNLSSYSFALIAVILIGSVQMIYWYYVTGKPLFYSYGKDQVFNWLSPNIYKCLFSTKAGWFIYSPIMIFALLGFMPLWKKKKALAQPLLIFTIIFMYICFSWKMWWYGGSLGQRAMIQAYPFLAIPLAVFYTWVGTSKWSKMAATFFFIAFVYLNLWYIHMAIKGPVFFGPPQVKTKYFFKQVGRWTQYKNNLKFLDTKEEFKGQIKSSTTIIDTSFTQPQVLDPKNKKNLKIKSQSIQTSNDEWLRVAVQLKLDFREWTYWKYTQLVVQIFDQKGKNLKNNFIRVDRLLDLEKKEWIEFDTELPSNQHLDFKVFLSNCGSMVPVELSGFKIEKISSK